MNFASPLFLWALSALAIPVIIHLFNFRRTTRVFFSNTRLLRQVRQETTQQRNLKRYLVLAARLLFLLFLVLAFAQPFIPAKEQMTSGKSSVIYLDNSYSMTGQPGEKTRALDVASGFVREILNLFPADTRYKLITNDFAPYSNSFKTKSEILDLLTQLRLSPVSRTFDEVKKRMGPVTRTDVFYISDFQKSTFGSKNTLATDTTNQWHLIPVSLGNVSNIFIDSLYLENPLMIGGEKNVIKARLHNTGVRRVQDLVVKLTINGVQSATASSVIEPNSTAEISFELNSRLNPLNKGRLSFSDFPISFDNDFYFTLNLSDKVNVIEIKSPSVPPYVEKVYGNNEFFKFKSFPAANVNFGLFDQADLVIVNGLDKIDDVLASALKRYTDKSGSLLIIPGSTGLRSPSLKLPISPSTPLNEPANSKGLPTDPVSNPLEPVSELVELDRPDFQNPFFENVFEDKNSLLTMPKAAPVLDLGTDRSALLRFKTGKSFLIRGGNTFILASPLAPGFTDFYNQPLFVPVMYRIAISGKKNESKPYYSLNEKLISVRADSLEGEEPLRLAGAQEIIPGQRRLGSKILMDIPRFAVTPGYYAVVHQRDTIDQIAFNLDKQESFTEQFSAEQVKDQLGAGKNISMFKASSQGTFSNEIKERYLGTPLWKQALALALLFLLAEVLLIRFLK